jgi:hypothetical protein
MVSVGIVHRDAATYVMIGGGCVSHIELGRPLPMVRFEEQGVIPRGLHERQALAAEFIGCAEITGNHVI